jgi:hypothetical protein
VFRVTPQAPESARDWRTPEEAAQAGERLVQLLRADATVPSLSARAWSALIEEAFRHRVAQLLYARLRDRPDDVPAPALARLRDFYARSALRTALNLRELGTVSGLLADRGIEMVALKGACLALEVYAEPALRPMADLDVLVRHSQLRAAERALLDAGWRSAPRADAAERETTYHHLAPLERAGGATVEVHWTIERPSSPFRIDIDGLWRRAQPSRGAPGVLVPAAEDLLLHLALHLAYHHRFERAALKQLCDVAAIVLRFGDTIDWPVLARTARDSRAEPFVRLTLRLAQQLLGAPVPTDAIAALAGTTGEDATLRAACNYIVTPPASMPSAYTRLAERRTLAAKAKLALETAFPGRAVLTAVHALEPGSRRWLLYAAVRPFELLVRRGRLAAEILFHARALRPALRREADRRRVYDWVDSTVAAAPPRPRSAHR